MRLVIQDVDLQHIPLDTERLLLLKIRLDNGNIFSVSERDGELHISVDAQIIVVPVASNAIRLRAD
jgi:hypothetical protein